MKTIEQLAREAGFINRAAFNHLDELQRFHSLAIAQYRESLLAGAGEPEWYHAECDDPDYSRFAQDKAEAAAIVSDKGGAISALYTADQLAAAVLRERERCAKRGEPVDKVAAMQRIVDSNTGHVRPTFSEWTSDYVRENLHKLAAPQGMYKAESIDGNQHNTGRVYTGAGSYFADAASFDNAKLIADALNAYTHPAPKTEPVAFMHEWADGERIPLLHAADDRNTDMPKSVRPLVYGDTRPAPKAPSDDEIWQAAMDACGELHGNKLHIDKAQIIAAFQSLVLDHPAPKAEPSQAQIKAAADAWLDCGSKLMLNRVRAALIAAQGAKT